MGFDQPAELRDRHQAGKEQVKTDSMKQRKWSPWEYQFFCVRAG